MKNFLLMLGFLCLFTNVHAQFASNSRNISTSSISPVLIHATPPDIHGDEPGVRMKRTGTALTIFGAILFVSGAALASQADALYYSSTTTSYGTVEEGDPQGGLGVVMLAAGTGMMVPGIIFWSKGAKKYKRYQEEQNVSLNVKGAGLSLRLKF
jgi:hypothetical protein